MDGQYYTTKKEARGETPRAVVPSFNDFFGVLSPLNSEITSLRTLRSLWFPKETKSAAGSRGTSLAVKRWLRALALERQPRNAKERLRRIAPK